MKNPHILPVSVAAPRPAGRSWLLVWPTPATSHQPSAPAWLTSSILWLVVNSPLPWRQKHALQQQVAAADLSLPAALELQRQAIAAIHTADLERKSQLRQRVAARIAHYPELFHQTAYGRQIAQSCVSKLHYEAAGWDELERLDHWTEVAVESWLDMNQRVEQALLDGEKMQADLRQALRDPARTLADDCTALRGVVAEFHRARTLGRPQYLLAKGRELFALLQDSAQPTALATELVRLLASAA